MSHICNTQKQLFIISPYAKFEHTWVRKKPCTEILAWRQTYNWPQHLQKHAATEFSQATTCKQNTLFIHILQKLSGSQLASVWSHMSATQATTYGLNISICIRLLRHGALDFRVRHPTKRQTTNQQSKCLSGTTCKQKQFA